MDELEDSPLVGWVFGPLLTHQYLTFFRDIDIGQTIHQRSKIRFSVWQHVTSFTRNPRNRRFLGPMFCMATCPSRRCWSWAALARRVS